MSYDIITFGSATLDIFVKTDKRDFSIKPERKFVDNKAICFPFASKVDVKDIDFFTGGGGTNTAAAFSSQGFKVAYCGCVGEDFAGQEVLKDINRLGIDSSLIIRTDKVPTNLSLIFSWDKDRTCFVWRGASEVLSGRRINFDRLKAQWFYLAPLSGRLSRLFIPLVNHAQRNKIGVLANLGNSQIELGLKKLKPLLKEVNILLLNQEEASLLADIAYQKEKAILKRLSALVKGMVVVTKGKRGVSVSDGNYIWKAGSLPVQVKEKTGAGDAFGSGFLTGFVQKGNIPYALQVGVANAASCIQRAGAKNGLLKKKTVWKKVTVIRKKL